MKIAAAACALALLAGAPVRSETLRLATYNPELYRDGPGLLLADILDREDDVLAAAQVIVHTAPDILLLTGFDWDHDGHALAAFADVLADLGAPFPHRFTARPNAGVPSGLDLDGDGRLGEPEDSWGYGTFVGQSGMAILSRFPLGEVRDFSGFLWRDLPGHQMPVENGEPFPSRAVAERQPLSSVAHWDVPVRVGATTLHLLAWHGTPPVFDGPEDRNGRRGADEALFWLHLLDGALPDAPPTGPIALIGISNIDPNDGDGRHDAMARLTRDPRLQDPAPTAPGGTAAANPAHRGDPAQDTADFSDPDPGNLRVDYLLPDARLTVEASGVVWPDPDTPLAKTVAAASRHRLVWVDVTLP